MKSESHTDAIISGACSRAVYAIHLRSVNAYRGELVLWRYASCEWDAYRDLRFSRLQNWASEIETSIFVSWDSVGSKNEIGFLEVCVQVFGGLQTALVVA